MDSIARQGRHAIVNGIRLHDVRLGRGWSPLVLIPVESHKSYHDEEIHSDLPKIKAPTLLMYAQNGGTVSDADADEIVAARAGGRKIRIDGAGHMIPWDRLDAFVAAVQEFLAR